METVVLTVLQLIASLLAQLGTSSTAVNQILAALIQIVPIVVNLGAPVVNSVKAIITALESSGSLTDDQLATLANLSAELDASWQSTVAAYNASKKVAPVIAAAAPAIVAPVAGDSAAPLSQAG